MLGPFDASNIHAILKTVNKTTALYDSMKPDSKVVNPAYPVTSPDHILVQGVLASGAVASFAFRKPPSTAVDDVGFRWLITGTKGEIEVTVPEMNWQFADPRMKLRIKKVGEETAREVDYVAGQEDERTAGQIHVALNTARSYDAFAKGDETRFATFESALATHELLQRIVESAGW